MTASPGEHIDLSGDEPLGSELDARADDANDTAARPFIGIYFECCGVYTRIYRRPDQREYRGRCPRCLRPVELRVGPEGTSARMFVAR